MNCFNRGYRARLAAVSYWNLTFSLRNLESSYESQNVAVLCFSISYTKDNYKGICAVRSQNSCTSFCEAGAGQEG